MIADQCKLHFMPMNQICGAEECSIIVCQACFAVHRKQRNHSSPIILNELTVSFFVSFNEFMLRKVDELIITVKNRGINDVFKIVGGIPTYWDTKSIFLEIQKIAIEVLTNYRNLTQNNTNYLAQNRFNYRALLHPEFLKDLYTMINQNWQRNASKMEQQLRLGLTITYPTRYIYRRIKFQLNPNTTNEIQYHKKQILSQNPEKIVKQELEPSKLSDLKISKVQSVIEKTFGSFSEDKMQPRISAHLDSFYEVLQNSQLDMKENSFQMNEILKENPPEQISPNFLSYEALQKYIEELLIENQRLKHANSHLIQENAALKKENRELKSMKNA